jgi:uncharacterized membrane protein YqgA involved in biofilm formation
VETGFGIDPCREETFMLGPGVNALTIVVCGLVGCFLVRGIPERLEEIIRKAIGLSIIYVGLKGALDNQRILLLIISMVTGAILGELINIDKLMTRFGDWAECRLDQGAKKDTGKSLRFSRGFVNASILFCTGSMAIVGSMQSGLQGNHETLFAKSILDGSMSIIFGASLGIGVVFSAIPTFIYQAGIALAAMFIKDYFTEDMIHEMSAVGSLLIAAIGFNFLAIKEIKVANLIPAVFIPGIYLGLESLFSR